MDGLAGRVALVTGADRGIGRAIALALASAGADVAINYRAQQADAQVVYEAITRLGRNAAAIQADVSQSADVIQLVQATEQQLGPIDILVNNAGIARRQPIDEIREEDWDELIAVNLKSVFLVTQAVLPGMRTRRWGRIINLSSVAAQQGGGIGPHYAASKAGILGLTHSYASLLAKEGITVNAIAPALIETDMVAQNLQHVNPVLTPVGRYGTVEEVADVAVMLAGNGYMTGQTIGVNGGHYFT